MGSVVMIIISPMFAVAGYVFKFFIDKFSKYKKNTQENKIKDIEYKLKEFYFPIYSYEELQDIILKEQTNLYKK